jgi:hypothetical protein
MFQYDRNPRQNDLKGNLYMTTAKDVMRLIKDNEVNHQEFRFADQRGKWRDVTFDISMIETERSSEGSCRVRLLRMTLRCTWRVARISHLAPRGGEHATSTAVVAPTDWGQRGLG